MITVIIPTHNREEGLKKAIHSLLYQSTPPSKIIIIDDASYSKITREKIGLPPSSIDIEIIRNPHPLGAAASRNLGIKKSTTPYISFLDDDDTFHPEKIKELTEIIKKHNPDIISNSANIFLKNENIRYKSIRLSNNIPTYKSSIISNFVGGCSMATCKTASLFECGLFDENLPALEDYDLWISFSKNKKSFFFTEKILTNYFYETSKSSLSRSSEKNKLARDIILKKHSKEILKFQKNDIKKLNESIIYDDFLRALLNYNKTEATELSKKMLINNFNFRNLIFYITSKLGTKFFFKIRSWNT